MSQAQPPSSGHGKVPPSSHRLPTISASEALQDLRENSPRAISTGLPQLDAWLAGNHEGDTTGLQEATAGLERGKLTELWGPPGAGKTTLALQAAANALRDGHSVVWVDASTELVRSRLNDLLGADTQQSLLSRIHAYSAPTLAHLLALILHSPAWLAPEDTALFVIDGLHTVFDVAYPKYQPPSAKSKTEAARWAAGRRYSVLGSLMAALKKMAVLKSMSVLVTSGCVTRMRPGSGLGAFLASSIGGTEWETGVSNRLVMFRDFGQSESARYVGLQKVGGTSLAEQGEVGRLLALRIDKNGVAQLAQSHIAGDSPVTSLPRLASSPISARKRNYEEIADSDDEASSEYGWLGEDEVAAEALVDEDAIAEDVAVDATVNAVEG